ncbi:site-specific DNA-methyltransferase [Parabacteroides sp. PF5-6]|uniref:DNA-methyltransferase n=1 Tax=Parabacteroides sp. PF5-6 TaxID=1742403 RepID=UPI002404D19C|nr:site-specific DNA-methyltransferase [Parabacteroides sp. PF5-6]MDF9830671.1 DNA modification methylase [Parabacteroides sp. PF5-6]
MVRTKRKSNVDVVYNEDSRRVLDIITPDIKVQTTITSPPYFDMKDYESDDQIGYGQTYNDYLMDLKSIFEGIHKITKEDGTLWIIIDTFKRNNQVVTLPFDLTDKLKEIGWLLQDIIIWKKDKTVPWSNSGFMQRKFEYILFFTKSSKYKSNRDSVRVYDTNHLKKWWVKYPERYNPKGKALDEVWEFPIPIQGSWGDKYIRHFCPLPQDMVATMIQISTDEDDIVLDPFAGSGTVLSQSAYMKRKYIGFETNNEYIKMFEAYIRRTFEIGRKEYELTNNNISQGQFEETILNLRALKYGRVLLTNIQKKSEFKKFKIIVEIDGASNLIHKLLKVKYRIIGEFDEALFANIIDNLIASPPLSKFGIEPCFSFEVISEDDLQGLYGYTQTNTYSFAKDGDISSHKVRILSPICVDLNENDYL